MMGPRVSKNVRWCALAAALALFASACGGDSGEDELSAADAAVMVNEAMDGTQAVQDFLIYVDMVVQTDDGPVSYYDQVLDRAAEGVGGSVELLGGLAFSPVDSLDGDVRDANGDTLDTVSLDFGLLTTSEETQLAGVQALVDLVGVSDSGELPYGLGVAPTADRTMLVEIFTADFSVKRTHVGLGDVGAKDLTFVSNIAPGDDLAAAYIFGQTFPGDLSTEEGLAPDELFAYRWNRGLFAIPGEDGSADVVFDGGVVAVDGSTIVLTEPKAAAALEARERGRMAALRILQVGIEASRILPADYTVNTGSRNYTFTHNADGDLMLAVRLEGQLQGGVWFGDDMMERFPALMALDACQREVRRLLRDNAAMFSVVEDPTWQRGRLDEPLDDDSNREVSDGDQREYCEKPFPPVAKAAGTYGDVHITTFDGWQYDNQAAGEFLVFDNGTATVQMRSAPWEDSDAVSVVTAIAARVGDHEVSMHQDGSIWIDGEIPTIARGETIAVGDAALLWTGAAWVIVWPDGTELRVSGGGQTIMTDDPESTFHPLLMLITITGESASGMMGSPDDDGRNDWVTRSGEQLDDDIRFDFESFYPTYIDTWRISDDESLFHYESGESTATFTIDGFPRRHYDIADLDPDAVAEAEAACVEGGIERPEMLDGCILDVALTGDVGFVYDTYLAQTHTSVATVPVDIEVNEPPPPADGQSVVSVGPLTVGFGADPPVIVPNFPGQWQCQAGADTFTATARFQETEERQYEIRVEYTSAAASRDGTERFRLVVQRNSDPIAWLITPADPMPGTLDSVEVNGSSLSATGTALLNDPYDATVFVGAADFGSARFEPMTLEVNCDQ